MSTYICKNSKQTGPFNDDEIVRGLHDGSFSYNDLCWREGMPDWQPLANFYSQAPQAPTVPKSIPPLSSVPVTSGLAIASLISGLAIFIFGPLAGIAAVITGHIARSQIKASLGRLTGRGLALAGLILGYFSIAIVPIIIVMFMLAAVGIPSFQRAKKRSQATRVLDDLRMLDSAIDQYSIETAKISGMQPSNEDLKPYLKHGTSLYNTFQDSFGHPYGPFTVDEIPKVSRETYNAFSDIADVDFWSPYY